MKKKTYWLTVAVQCVHIIIIIFYAIISSAGVSYELENNIQRTLFD